MSKGKIIVSRPVYIGIDLGSSRTKLAVIDENKNLIGHAIRKSGTDYAKTAEIVLTGRTPRQTLRLK